MRWVQLSLWTLTMMMVGALQYGWTLFVGPIDAQFHWGRAAIQTGFTVIIMVEAFSTVPIGRVIDAVGARWAVLASGALIALGGYLNSTATSLEQLYLGCAVAGVGVGVISCGAPNGVIRWFPNHRGLAAGVVVTGFVLGSLGTILWMYDLIQTRGWATTFLVVGLVQGAVIAASAFFLRSPREGEAPPLVVPTRRGDATTREAVSSSAFWVLFALFVLVGTGGLMVTAQFSLIAADLRVGGVPVSVLGLTMAALPLAIVFDRVMNGACRPMFGWISDHIGRENTMALAFFLEAASVLAFILLAHDPVMFVLLSGCVFFAWGEIFSLMPTTTADIFGTTNATTIFGILYSAKGVASIGTPLANLLMSATGSWSSVFYAVVAMDVLAALVALLVLKPIHRKRGVIA